MLILRCGSWILLTDMCNFRGSIRYEIPGTYRWLLFVLGHQASVQMASGTVRQQIQKLPAGGILAHVSYTSFQFTSVYTTWGGRQRYEELRNMQMDLNMSARVS